MGSRAKNQEAPNPRLADRIGHLWDWWLGELSALVPNRLRAIFAARPAALVCVVGEDGRVACARAGRAGALPDPAGALPPGPDLLARLGEIAGRRRTVRLSVPRAFCLLRRTRLPARALRHADVILAHEIEAVMPSNAGEILADWFVEGEDPATGELHMVQVVLSRSRLRELDEALAEAGLRITHLTVGDAEGAVLPVDLVATREPSLRRGFARLPASARLAYAAAAALLVATPFLAVARQSEALDGLAVAPRLSPAAQAAVAVANAMETGADRVSTLAVLDELARRLPEGASLAGFRRIGDQVEVGLQGAQTEPARFAFAASPLFRCVEAAGEAGPNASRLRFDLISRAALRTKEGGG